MKITSIVGARPQFIKAAALSREIRKSHLETLVHTGQHYDYKMSGVFFDGLEIPAPDVNLEVGSGSHGQQTGKMLEAIEKLFLTTRPDRVLVYGDTNSTLAGALAAAKLHIPVVHVEAGLRSFNKKMPEEVNRILTDHVSDLLLCPSDTAVKHLQSEGITRNVHMVGDVMLDILNWARERLNGKSKAMLGDLGVQEKGYLLATVHRSENTDEPDRLRAILGAFNEVNEPILFPVHPRARKQIAASGFQVAPHVRLIEPLGYSEMVAAASSARMILTDSGGLQKEAYWLQVPCVTLREETEWVETVATGWNKVVGSNSAAIVQSVKTFSPPAAHPALYGEGNVSLKCVNLLQ